MAKTYVPKKCVFESTLACNLRCKHCGSRAGKARPDELTTEECADMFAQLADLGCRRVVIAGGEPLTRPDWPELIEAAAATGMRVGLITNAVTFDDDAIRLALDKGLGAVGFSLDGLGETHDRIRGKVGHFNRITRAMEASARAGLPFAVVTFVSSLNLGRLDEMHDLVASRGAYAWQVQLGTDMGNLHDNPDLLLRPTDLPRLNEELAGLIRRSELRIEVADSIGYYGPGEKILRTSLGGKPFGGCAAGIKNLGIESNGNVKGCLSIMAGYNPEGRDFVEGNIREERLAEIWHRPGAFAYNRQWSLDDLGGFCRECKHARKCRGGCRSEMVAVGENVENPMCLYRVIAEEAARTRRASPAAAVVLASLIGASGQGCYKSADDDDDTGDLDGGEGGDAGADADSDGDGDVDTDADSDTDSDTDSDSDSDSDSDTDTDSDSWTGEVDHYGIPDTDTSSDTGTNPVDPYGIPDTDTTSGDVDLYGLPDTETDTENNDKYGFPDTDTES